MSQNLEVRRLVLCQEVTVVTEALGQARGDDQLFEQLRPELFGLAYRMLAIAADAEDTVHEAYLRWRAKPRGDIRSPKAFLVTVVTRLCLDALDSARARRETYVGPWLPEPLLVDELGPAGASELSDSLSLAFLVVLEELSPLERAAFLLHDVFGYDYAGLSTALNREQGACRQLVARARTHVTARRRRFEADQRRAREVTQQFLAACAGGDLKALLDVLADDVVVWTDGGGKAKAAPKPVLGAAKAARFLLAVARGTPEETEVIEAALNGQPGLLALYGGSAVSAVVLDITEGQVDGVMVIANPDKLRAVNAALAERRKADASIKREEPK
jgi:RNA polymerase sigma-70 factor, ECF subfamily